jgi:hypothetical protein
MLHARMFCALAVLLVLTGCSSKPKLAQLSGMVTFKNQPVPAGWISFTPDVAQGGLGAVKVFQIKEGAYDSAKEKVSGIQPGTYFVKIAGFDGKKIPLWGQGKQIFNVVDTTFVVPAGTTNKDWPIPDSAGQNVKIVPTADP